MSTTKAAAAAILLGICLGCETTDGMRLRTGVGGGISEVNLSLDGSDGSVDGSQASGRIELARGVPDLPNMEVGLRMFGGMHSVDEPIGSTGINYELDSIDLGLAPVIRGRLPFNDEAAIFLEVFGGYRHHWGDETLSDASGSLEGEGDKGGFIFGAGLGFEFALSEGSAFFVGGEWSRTLLDFDDASLDVDVDDLSAVIGLEFDF